MNVLRPDLSLIQKYNQPGPRYTSYPTAPHFTEKVDVAALEREAQQETGPISLYFHIPFCESLCWFCGCTTIVNTKRDRADDYLDLLEKEIDLYCKGIQPGRKVQQLHFGGGTPNFLTPAMIDRFASFLKSLFEFAPDAEMSAELDPRRLTKEHIEAFARLGINRVSFGVQDVQEVTQKAVNRVQPDEVNRNAIKWAREAGMHSLNIDLIYGLPYQTPESIVKTIEQVLEYDPDRLAVFSYAHVPWMRPAQKILERHGLPDPEQKVAMLGVVIETLTANGYHYVGMDHFAKETDKLAIAQKEKTMQRNFQGYSTFKDVEICAFGMSSISQTKNSYRQNYKNLKDYQAAVEAGKLPVERGYILTDDDKIRRETIMRVMCDLSLNFEVMSEQLGVNFQQYFAVELSKMQGFVEDGLIVMDDDGIEVTEQGSLFIRNIAMLFDAYLGSGAAQHSKTV